MNDSPNQGFLMNRRRKPTNSRNNDQDFIDPNIDEKTRLYTSPQIRMDRLVSIIKSTILLKMDEDDDNRKYDPVRAKLMCQALSKDIRSKVKGELELKRYRIVCVVSIIEKHLQSIDYKMMFCVDYDVDYYGNFKFETAQYYIIATVYVVYKD